MDVAAPKSPAPVANPFTPPVTASPALTPSQPAELPVRPAPFAQAAPISASLTGASQTLSRHGKKAPQSAPQPHAPVALITVTVFVMLVLSALAVTVYVTTKTA